MLSQKSFEEIQRNGIDALRREVVEIAPFLRSRLGELKDWNDIRLLTVRIDRLKRWYRTGLLCIGDAAHNVADWRSWDQPCDSGRGCRCEYAGGSLTYRLHTRNHLAAVERRRAFATRVTQAFQVIIQKQLVERVSPVPVERNCPGFSG